MKSASKQESASQAREYPLPKSIEDFVEVLIVADQWTAGEMRDVRRDHPVEVDCVDPSMALVCEVRVSFPRGNARGAPVLATFDGAKDHMGKLLSFGFCENLRIEAKSGSPNAPVWFEIKALVHKDIVRYVDISYPYPKCRT